MALNEDWIMNIRQIRVDINAEKERLKNAITPAEALEIASVYADDVVALPPSGRVYRGRTDIQRMWQLMIRN
jgi:ketosteroid isomerase-like protein